MNAPPSTRTSLRRLVALSLALAGTAFWLYTFYWLAQLPAGDGSGMQWVAAVPLGLIFLLFTLPALILAFKGQSLTVSLVLGAVGLAAFAALFLQLLSEL